MTPYVDCTFAQARLEACLDQELPVEEQIRVEAHLRWCSTCRSRIEDWQVIGAAVRQQAGGRDGALVSDAALAGMRAEVLRQVDVDRARSWQTRLQVLAHACTDQRFVWPARGATLAVALCVGLASTVWRATSAEQPTSLADMIDALSDPGSDRNPLRLDGAISVPRVVGGDNTAEAVLVAQEADDEVLALATVVRRDGKVGTYEVLGTGATRARYAPRSGERDILDAVRLTRFAPAQAPGGRTVAVNMVWLLAKTTVRASGVTVDLGVPLARPTPARQRAISTEGVTPRPTPLEDAPVERRSGGALSSATA